MALRSKLSWYLCDRRGIQLAQLTNRLEQPQVQLSLNGQRTATVAISTEDPAARYVYPLLTRLKVFLGDQLLINGRVQVANMAAERPSRGQVEISAVDASAQLMASYWGRFADPLPAGSKWFDRTYSNQKQEDIAYDLILEADRWADDTRGATQFVHRYPNDPDNEIPGTGIVLGTHTGGTVRRDRNYPEGKQIWEALAQLANARDGFDFMLTPLDREDDVNCKLDTFYPKLGSDKSGSVIFEYGLARDNCSNFGWQPDGTWVINRYALIGQSVNGKPSKVWVAENRESQKLFGIWQLVEGMPDTTSVTRLREHAERKVAFHAFPADAFTLTPAAEIGSTATGFRRAADGTLEPVDGEDYAVPPAFGPGSGYDYWIGDTVGARARLGPTGQPPNIELDLQGRVTDATITEVDEDGNVVVEPTCNLVIDRSNVTGYQSEASVRGAI